MDAIQDTATAFRIGRLRFRHWRTGVKGLGEMAIFWGFDY